MKAIVVTSPGKGSLVSDRPLPKPRDEYMLVKTVSVALNPTDWMSIQKVAAPGSLIGCDYAGIVEEVGTGIKKSFKKGDRVYGFAHGGNSIQPEDGAFAEYILVKGDLVNIIPDNLSFQEAATLGVGLATVGQSLYQSLKLNLPTAPRSEPVPLLIYGGSTATGTLAIQFAKLSGYQVIATASPHNFDLLKSLGADAVFDSRDPAAGAEIRKFTDNKLKLVLDTIATEAAAKFCDDAISSEGGDYSSLLIVKIERKNVKDRWTLGYTIFGEDFEYMAAVKANAEDRAFAERFLPLADQLLADGKVKVHKPKVLPGGLGGILEGLKLLEGRKVSGEKLVYNVDETA
ncbi:hypothetical protein ACHAQA_000061 [Verticillium albo-atrum]